MRILATAILGVAVLSACAPVSEAGKKRGEVANFGYAVGKEVRGRYDPAIFQKDRVDGHVRRACKNDELSLTMHTPSGGIVTFIARCRLGTLPNAKGRWIVRRLADGNEQVERHN